MAYKRKSWKEKFDNGHPAHVEVTTRKFADIPEHASMLIATPAIVDAYIRDIPEGHHCSLQQMRKDLAAAHNAQYTCPITSGIFLRIVAEHSYEDYQAGKPLKRTTPFWRMIDSNAPIVKKLTFDTGFIREMREKEGLPF